MAWTVKLFNKKIIDYDKKRQIPKDFDTSTHSYVRPEPEPDFR